MMVLSSPPCYYGSISQRHEGISYYTRGGSGPDEGLVRQV